MNAPVNNENRDSHGDPETRIFVILSEACPSEASFLMCTFLERVVELVVESIVHRGGGGGGGVEIDVFDRLFRGTSGLWGE